MDLAAFGERQWRFLGHGIDGVGSCQRLDIEAGRGFRVLRSGAGPQHALLARTLGLQVLPPLGGDQFAMRTIGALHDGDAQSIVQFLRYLVLDRAIPAADEYGCDLVDFWV